ncbi:MAG: EthD domain-containing protein [Proteobacteria bacterium]|nr:EthD domain-containing protein [Pseudomonadota bacterium]
MTMFKLIALIKAKPGLTREQFMAHYEGVHVPLVLRLMPKIVDYRRNYAQAQGAYLANGITALDFDAVTEVRYASRADYEAVLALLKDPAFVAQIAADEEHFLDRSKTRLFEVEEHISENLG